MVPYVILNIVLSALIVASIVGFLMWSVVTQHRDHGCEGVRLRLRRLPSGVTLMGLEPLQTRQDLADPPQLAPVA